MSTFTKLIYHVVFSTKFRQPLITLEIQSKLYDYIGGIIRSQNGRLIEIGGIEDHVHMLVNFPATKTISDCVKEIKANSSRWRNELSNQKGRFEWQKGYGIFSVSYSQLDAVRYYMQHQRKSLNIYLIWLTNLKFLAYINLFDSAK